MRRKLNLISFALYDAGETLLGALIYSTFFPLFITKYIDPKTYSALYGVAFLISFFLALYLGKLADTKGLRKQLFVIFSLLTAFSGMSLSLFANLPYLALLVYCMMAVFHQQALVFYNSMLLSFDSRGLASGLGVAVGYISSAIALVFLARLMSVPDVFFQASFLFALLVLPSLLLLPNPPQRERVEIKEVLKDRKFLLTILAILSLTEVANTLIAMMGIYLKRVYGFEDTQIYRVIGLSAFGGVVGGMIFGRLTDRWGASKLFPMGFFFWSLFLALLYFTPKHLTLVVGFLAGLSLAHLWTTSRLFVIENFPQTQVSVRLSFLSLTERIASTSGLFAWSLLLYLTGDNYRLSALLMIVFPLLGFIIFRKSRVVSL
ncbi:MFS transporter [Hydrogenobacter thermophilus]|uniref:MFS transporter n=1 Tax=Hydrogenobacter thermophilus TaxID=940 RepID=UPI0030FAE7B7